MPEYRGRRPEVFWDRRGRGFGPSNTNRVVSCAEENVLCYPGDAWVAENILIHEFGHAIHWTLKHMKGGFDERLRKTYEKACAKGLWKNKYAGTNRDEYWAEGVQSWFDTNRANDHDHNHVDTREELIEYDPNLASLIRETLGEINWRYKRPADREKPGHLKGYDPKKAPRFKWPEGMKKWWVSEKKSYLPPLDIKRLETIKSTGSDVKTDFFILNRTGRKIKVYWIDFKGRRQFRGAVRPKMTFHSHTFPTHPWLVTEMDEKPIGLYLPDRERYLVVLEK
jgi:hypothetical protein